MPTGSHISGVFICPEVGSHHVAQAGLTLWLLPPPPKCPVAEACQCGQMLPQPPSYRGHRKQEPHLCLPFLDRPVEELTLEQQCCQHMTCVAAPSAPSLT